MNNAGYKWAQRGADLALPNPFVILHQKQPIAKTGFQRSPSLASVLLGKVSGKMGAEDTSDTEDGENSRQ